MHTTHHTFRRILARSLATKAALFVMVAAYWTGLALGGAGAVAAPSSPADLNKPPAPGSPAAVLAEHDCWTGDAPADMTGKLPGHVVVTLPNDTTVHAGARMVAKAMDQVFNSTDHGLIVRGFCR